jgi:hypothetical protein
MSILDDLFGPSVSAGRAIGPSGSDLTSVRRQAIPSPSGGYDPTDDLAFAAEESGVSLAELQGHAGTESAGGRNMVNPRSSASGPLQVIRGTFDEVNRDHYGNALDWNSNRDKARAGARYYRSQLDKYGDRETALGAYFVGPGKADELLSSGGRDALMAYAPPNQGRRITVGEYVAKTTGTYEERGSNGSQPEQPLEAANPLDALFSGPIAQGQPEGEPSWGDFGAEAKITAGDFAKAGVGIAENVAGMAERSLSGIPSLFAQDVNRAMGEARQGITGWQKGVFDTLTPEALERGQRELLTLDPDKTIWKGGPSEFLSSMAHKAMLSAGPTIGPMLTAAVLQRVGMGAAMSSLYGASEGLMSAGLTASGIADDIASTDLSELQTVPRFAQLYQQHGEAEARRLYTNEAQGLIPAITGLLTGTIAKKVGGRLDKVFGVEDGLGVANRAAAGFITEAGQEAPQSFMEQVMQNYAQMAYDSDVSLFDGAAESAVQGALIGGPMGGVFAAAFGSRPQNKPRVSNDPVSEDIRAAIGASAPKPAAPAAAAQAIPTRATPPVGASPPELDVDALMGNPDEDEADEAQQVLNPVEPAMVDLERYAGPEFEDKFAGGPQFTDAPSELGPEPSEVVPQTGIYGVDNTKPEADESTVGTELGRWQETGGLDLPPPPAKQGLSLVEDMPVEPAVEQAIGTYDSVQPDFLAGPPATEPSKDLMDPSAGMEFGQAPPINVNKGVEPKYGQRTRTEQLGFRVRRMTRDGKLVESKLVDGKLAAEFIRNRMEKDLDKSGSTDVVQMFPARRTFRNDRTPTAEPAADLVAQASDLKDPNSSRKGVYVTRESLQHLKAKGQLDAVLRAGVPINNFDTYGGVLVAKDEEAAQELVSMLESDTGNIDEILGYATGAGVEKPRNAGGKSLVVQKLAGAAVIRERLVANDAEAQQVAREFGGRTRITTLDDALKLRKARLEVEQKEDSVAAEQAAYTDSKPGDAISALFEENPITAPKAEKAKALADEGGFEEDIGGRIIEYARDVRGGELKRRADKDIPNPKDVVFRGREVTDRLRERTRLLRQAAKAKQEGDKKAAKALTEQAEGIKKSIAGGTKVRNDIAEAYKETHAKFLDALIARAELGKLAPATVEAVEDADTKVDTLRKELTDLLATEGGYTKSEAIAYAATRFSPRGKKSVLDAIAKRRDERRAEEAETDTKPDKRLVLASEREKVNIQSAAAEFRQRGAKVTTADGQALVEMLADFMAPSMAKDMDKYLGDIEGLSPKEVEKRRGEMGVALVEIHQLLTQWLSDYRSALLNNEPANDYESRRNGKLAAHAARLTEMMGALRNSIVRNGEATEDALAYISDSIGSLVVRGKRLGVGSLMDIDGFWDAAEAGPLEFREYLDNTVASRDELPFPTALDKEDLDKLSLASLNSLWVKAQESLGWERGSDGVRSAIVAEIRKAYGSKYSDQPETVEVMHRGKLVTREVSPRKLFMEVFTKSYGVRGAENRMPMEQLKELYLKGGTVYIYKNGYVSYTKEGDPVSTAKGKPKEVVLKPLGTSLPEAQPLNVQVRRVSDSAKKKIILRAVAAQSKKRYGGKGKGTPLTRTEKGSGKYLTRDTGYDTGTLLGDSAPREMTPAQKAEHEEKTKEAQEHLNDALSDASLVVTHLLNSEKFATQVEKIPGAAYAKAYYRWLFDYGNALKNAHLKSRKGLAEMNKVAEDLRNIGAMQPAEFVKALEGKMRAESREQLLRAVALDPKKLGTLKDPATREQTLADQHKKIRKMLTRFERVSNLWKNDDGFQNVIAPVLKRISDSLLTTNVKTYEPTAQEVADVKKLLDIWGNAATDARVRSAAKISMRQAKMYATHFHKPLVESLEAAGFFDRDMALLKQFNRKFGVQEDKGEGIRLDTGRTDAVKYDQAATKQMQEISLTTTTDPAVEAALVRVVKANDSISTFRTILGDPRATIHVIEQAENRMLAELQALGVYSGGDLGRISLGDIAVASEEISQQQHKLDAALKKLAPSRIAEEGDPNEIIETPRRSPAAELAVAQAHERLRELSRELRDLQNVRAAFKGGKTITYRKVGDRLRSGEMTKAEAREMVLSRLSQFQIGRMQADMVDMVEAFDYTQRENLDYAQRKVFDRVKVPMQASGDAAPATKAESNAASALRALLRDAGERRRFPDGPKGWAIISDLRQHLGEDHFYAPLLSQLDNIRYLKQLNLEVSTSLESTAAFTRGDDQMPPTVLVSDMTHDISDAELIHTVIHEFVHAATMGELTTNPELAAAWEDLRLLTVRSLKGRPEYAALTYGFTDLYEFVAEVHSNPALQAAMKTVRVQGTVGKLWARVKALALKMLGMEPKWANLLDVAMTFSPSTLSGKEFTQRGEQRYLSGYKGAVPAAEDMFEDVPQRGFIPYITNEQVRRVAQPLLDSAVMQSKQVKSVQAKATDWGDNARMGGSNFMLSALTMRQLKDIYAKEFGDKSGPLATYVDAYFARNADSATLLERSDKLSRAWTKLEEQNPAAELKLSTLMRDATVLGIHPDVAFDHESNEHLDDSQRDNWKSLNDDWNSLPREAQQLYNSVAEYYQETTTAEVKLMLASALRASKLGSNEVDVDSIDLTAVSKGEWLENHFGVDLKGTKAQLAADEAALEKRVAKGELTKEQARAERRSLAERNSEYADLVEEMQLISRMASIPIKQAGPYFPLMRFGDYVTKAEKVVEHLTFDSRAERAAYMAAKQKEDPTLQFSYPQGDTVQLTVSEVEFRMAETMSEAEANRAELVKQYGKATPVQLKRDLLNSESTISSNRALQTLLGKLDGNAAAQAAIRQFYIKSLSDRSFRKREAKRKNIRGVRADLQHRTFANYAKSAAYYTAQLKHGWKMADAKNDMSKWVEGHTDETHISGVRMGQVVREINTRDQQSATLVETSDGVRKIVEAGQFWLLLSPSYWMINLSQPYMVTMPWLAGHSTMGEATAAMAKAQSLVIDPIVTQGAKSWGGLKAIKSRVAAEEAFSVIEKVEDTIKSRLGADAQPVLDMLTELKRESIIDMSFVAELRDVAAGESKSLSGKILDASRVLAHLTEVNNRITTAIAAYNVGKGRGFSEAAAVDFAKRAVVETQFDYSAGNKPRLFSANDAWWKPMVFQFMQYAQHMYVMFIRYSALAMKGQSKAEKMKGARVALGLLATHFAAAGLVGITAALPIKWALGLAMLVFGAGDDEDKTFMNLLSGKYQDRVMAEVIGDIVGENKLGEVIRAGLPRAIGMDVSNRMAFLQTYMIDLDPKNAETLFGSLALTFGGPAFGLAGNAYEGSKLLMEGDADRGLEKMVPKMGRDAIRAWRYWYDGGITDHTGKEIYGVENLSPWDLFLKTVGFQSATEAEMYARNSTLRDRKGYIDGEKARIGAAFRKARLTGELKSVLAERDEFNRKFPQDRITMSALLRGQKALRKAERNIQMFGVDAGKPGASAFLAEDDTGYNVE